VFHVRDAPHAVVLVKESGLIVDGIHNQEMNVFRRAKLTPLAGQSASNFDPPQVSSDHPLHGSGWRGS
jgi:hypothetical protein